MLCIICKIRHILMEWAPGNWTRAPFDIWDTVHFFDYVQYYGVEGDAIDRTIGVLEQW
jgi:hypothetical protein